MLLLAYAQLNPTSFSMLCFLSHSSLYIYKSSLLGVVVISILYISLAMWMLTVLALALLNASFIAGQEEGGEEIQCIGTDVFPPQSSYTLQKYCTLYYNFSGGDCYSVSKFQGHGFGKEGYDGFCVPLQKTPTSEFHYTLIICFCSGKHRCNTLRNVQKMMKGGIKEIGADGVVGYVSFVKSETPIFFECMQKDIDERVEKSKKEKKSKKNDGGLPIGVGYLVLIIVGGVLLIGAIVALTPFLIKWHRARHKKWLEETWEERVRQAAKELNVQGSKEADDAKKPMYDKKTRAGRKALKTMIASKEGSKESKSKDDLFPAAVGPNEQGPSAEKFSAEGRGSAEAGGVNGKGFGAPAGRGFSNEAQGMVQ